MEISKDFLVILGVAHSDNVAGKQSPDGRHHEPVWSKAQCKLIKEILDQQGINNVIIQPQSDDLTGRVNFVKMCEAASKPYKRALLLSLHNNAAGSGLWMTAHGWCVYTSKGSTRSDVYANKLWYMLNVALPNLPVRQFSVNGEKDFEENFTVLMGKNYSAVLVEWLFQDNKEDLLLIENTEICTTMRATLVNWIRRIKGGEYEI